MVCGPMRRPVAIAAMPARKRPNRSRAPSAATPQRRPATTPARPSGQPCVEFNLTAVAFLC